MAYTDIDKPSDYFNTKLYTGNNTTNAITGVGFQPDLVWGKKRDSAGHSQLYDNVRGVRKIINSSLTNAEVTESSGYGLESFDSDGFTLGADPLVASGSINASGGTYASWSWLASNTTASNTDGSITSTVSANTTSGFSIVSYSGNSTSGATVGHGLGIKPSMFIVKGRTIAEQWEVYHTSLGATKNLSLDSTSGSVSQISRWNNTEPTSSVFSLGNSGATNTSGNTYIAYCFAEKKGFSKFGSYTGNGNADGTFVYTGFKPAFILIKNANAAQSWRLVDNKRIGYNPNNIQLYPNLSNAESTSEYVVDIVSNGFKVIATDAGVNGSGNTMIYMAFAENPLVGTNNIPATAR